MNANETLSELRQHVHAYIDRLSSDQLSVVHGLLDTMLSPLDRKLALAPIDDEPLTPEDTAAVQVGNASLNAGRGVSMEDVLSDFGLTMEDFQKLSAEPCSFDFD